MTAAGALSGRTILLTGASRGIGACTARVLGAQGASVVAHYGTHREGAEEAVAGIDPERRLLVAADMSQPGAGARPVDRGGRLAWPSRRPRGERRDDAHHRLRRV